MTNQIPTDPTENDSPFPSASEMDMDLWAASPAVGTDSTRMVSAAGSVMVKVYGTAHADPARDAVCRRIELCGFLYDELRLLADRAADAGLDVNQARSVMTDFVAPKPFNEV